MHLNLFLITKTHVINDMNFISSDKQMAVFRFA